MSDDLKTLLANAQAARSLRHDQQERDERQLEVERQRQLQMHSMEGFYQQSKVVWLRNLKSALRKIVEGKRESIPHKTFSVYSEGDIPFYIRFVQEAGLVVTSLKREPRSGTTGILWETIIEVDFA